MGVLCQRPKGLVISFLLLLALLFSVSASAQITSQTGAVRVFVTDPQGAAVAGAKVTLSSGVRADLTKETIDRKSTRLNSVTSNLVCRLLLEKKKQNAAHRQRSGRHETRGDRMTPIAQETITV